MLRQLHISMLLSSNLLIMKGLRLYGPVPQAGKTTLMRILREELEQRGSQTLYMSQDSEADRDAFSSQSALIERMRLAFGDKPGIAFIDEIQRKMDAGIFLKGIYDMRLPYKLVVSGSGSLELKEKIHESLTGRKQEFELFTLSFMEFALFRTDYAYEKRMQDFFTIESSRAETLLREYIRFGGYPAVVLAENKDLKIARLDEIYQSYLIRDISALLNVEKTDAFSDLVRLLAGQAGNLINANELSATLGISLPTIKRYLWYLEKTYVASRVRPFYRNARKEIVKAPVFYFHDIGMRNMAARELEAVASSSEGIVFENFVFVLLRDLLRTGDSLHFWRTKTGAEVDFVLMRGGTGIPIEVKSGGMRRSVVGKSMHSFIGQYEPKNALIVTKSYRDKLSVHNTTVRFLPFYELLEAFLHGLT